MSVEGQEEEQASATNHVSGMLCSLQPSCGSLKRLGLLMNCLPPQRLKWFVVAFIWQTWQGLARGDSIKLFCKLGEGGI